METPCLAPVVTRNTTTLVLNRMMNRVQSFVAGLETPKCRRDLARLNIALTFWSCILNHFADYAPLIYRHDHVFKPAFSTFFIFFPLFLLQWCYVLREAWMVDDHHRPNVGFTRLVFATSVGVSSLWVLTFTFVNHATLLAFVLMMSYWVLILVLYVDVVARVGPRLHLRSHSPSLGGPTTFTSTDALSHGTSTVSRSRVYTCLKRGAIFRSDDSDIQENG